ncbi:hypothetical protein F5Y11DRAFT_362086 [Daldinia sp. FL1419]|nr:hypothetical protein F5Y11DRAFT_362086 [Daldinia sp. FL1419]
MGYTFEDSLHNELMGTTVILSLATIPVCVLATALRLIATRRSRRKLDWDDLSAFLALASFLVYALAVLAWAGLIGNMDYLSMVVFSAKLAYAIASFFYMNQLFARGSLFILYYRLFWSDPVFIKWIYALAAIHVSWFITFEFLFLFFCTPISKWWDATHTKPGHCIDSNTFMFTSETLNSSLDFATIILTVAVVQRLQTRQYIKTKLIFIFTIGGLSGIIGFVKIGLIYASDLAHGKSKSDPNAFWDLLQMATSVLCACAPMFQAIIPLRGVWTFLKSSITSWAGQSKQCEMLPGSELALSGSGHTHEGDGYSDGGVRPMPAAQSRFDHDYLITESTQSSRGMVDMESPIRDAMDKKTLHSKIGVAIG